MGVAGLKSYANVKCYLTANADNRDITVSAADAVILSNWAGNFGTRKCRLLLSTFAKYDQQNYNQTTFVVSGINTTTGVITPCENIPSHTNYTTTGYAYVGINLIPDGDQEQYSSGYLNATGLTNFKDRTTALSGQQSLNCKATTASGEGYIDLTVSGLENYNTSFWYKTGASGEEVKLQFIDQTNNTLSGYNELIYDTGVLDAQKWTYKDFGLRVQNTQWYQDQKFIASDYGTNDYYGSSVYISSKYLIVGAKGETSNKGAAYAYTKSGTSWVGEQKLIPNASNEAFGSGVDCDDTTLVVGAPTASDSTGGAAYTYTRSGNAWVFGQKLIDAGAYNQERAGATVGVDGSYLVIGAHQEDGAGDAMGNSGMVYAYTLSGTTWVKSQEIEPADIAINDNYALSLALSGNKMIVGSPYHDTPHGNGGAVYMYTLSGTSWVQDQKFPPTAGNSELGTFVAIDGDYAVAGAYHDDVAASNAGAAFIYTYSGVNWVKQVELRPADLVGSDDFGGRVAISGTTVAVSARAQDSSAGAVYIFTRSGTSWTQTKRITALDRSSSDEFGWGGLSLYGNTVAIGAEDDHIKTTADAGSVYLFEYGNPPITTMRVKAIGENADDRFWIDRLNVTQTVNQDPGFEAATMATDWQSTGPTNTVVASGVDHHIRTGSQVLEIQNSDSDSYKYREFPTVSGNYYHIKTHVKTNGAGTATVVHRDLAADLHVDPGFDSPGNWDFNASYWSVANGVGTYLGNNENGAFDQNPNITVETGVVYIHQFTINSSTGTVKPRVGGVFGTSRSNPGHYSEPITTTTTGQPSLRGGGGGTQEVVFDDFSIRKQWSTKSLITASGEYQELSYVYKAEGTTGRIELYNDSGYMYVDDLVIEPLEVVTPSTETPSTAANSYNTGRWGTASYAFRVDGSDTLTWTTDSRLGNQTGSFGINVKMMPFDSYPQDAYLWGVEDVFKLYYDSTNYQFKFEVYDGAAWQVASGPVMGNTVSGWKHVCATWDNSAGADIYINTVSGYRHGESWTAQTLPTNMYVCSHWAGNKQWDTPFDDVVIYQNTLSQANITSLFDA